MYVFVWYARKFWKVLRPIKKDPPPPTTTTTIKKISDIWSFGLNFVKWLRPRTFQHPSSNKLNCTSLKCWLIQIIKLCQLIDSFIIYWISPFSVSVISFMQSAIFFPQHESSYLFKWFCMACYCCCISNNNDKMYKSLTFNASALHKCRQEKSMVKS